MILFYFISLLVHFKYRFAGWFVTVEVCIPEVSPFLGRVCMYPVVVNPPWSFSIPKVSCLVLYSVVFSGCQFVVPEVCVSVVLYPVVVWF
jgi:hypothetical protein